MGSADSDFGWEAINDSSRPEYYVQTLNTITGWEFVRDYKNQSIMMLNLSEGQSCLDVGCGLGDDVLALSGHVGEKGLVVGLDSSEEMINRARKRLQEYPHPGVRFEVGRASALPFDDEHFHGCRADRVLQHVRDRETAIAEMVRVTKPGGRIVTIDPDWETMVFDVPDVKLARKVASAMCDRVRNGWAAHQSPGMFLQAGLTEIAAVPITSILSEVKLARAVLEMDLALEELERDGLLTSEEVNAWNQLLEDADREGRFFGSMTGFICMGVKPS